MRQPSQMNNFRPTSGSESEWKEARARVAAYLRALHLANEERQEWITSAVLLQAAARHAQKPEENPITLAMTEIRDVSEQWLGKLIESGDRVSAAGFVSLFAADTMEKWPAVFLAADIPADFQIALRELWVRAAPDLQLSRMVPQPFDNALQDAIALSAPLAELAKKKAPLLARVFTVVVSWISVSWISIWPGNKLR